MSRNSIVNLAAVAALGLSVLAPTIALARGANFGFGASRWSGYHYYPYHPTPNIGQGSSCCYTPPRGNKAVPK
jgi:hypothetical protein